MLRKKKESVEWLEFELLTDIPKLTHGVFLRHGGVSDDSFASLNAIRNTGDSSENVEENRKRILSCLELQKLITKKQIHSNHVEWVKDSDFPQLPCDALITNCQNVGLMTAHADCQAAIFYDPETHSLAAIHAGWRGQVKNIYKETILKMKAAFATKPENLLVAISPSLGPQNSEFKNYKHELPEEFWPFQIKDTYFDLWAIARYQLEKLGILPHHLQIAEIDTFANPQDFFSFRRDRKVGDTGNLYGGHATLSALL